MVRVRVVQPGGLAATSGLRPEDVVLFINGTSCKNAADAARKLRESTGELTLTVERSLTCDVGTVKSLVKLPASDEEKEEVDEQESTEDEESEEESDSEDEDSDEEEPSDEASAGEWTEWLSWMTERIQARETELAKAQQTMVSRKPWLEVDSDLVEEKREIASMITLLGDRRSELDLYLEFVDDLNDEDTDRIEEIYEELAHHEEGRTVLEDEDGDMFPGSFFTPRRHSPRLTARRSESSEKAAVGGSKVGKAQSETSEESSGRSEPVSEEEVVVESSERAHAVTDEGAKAESLVTTGPIPAVDAPKPAVDLPVSAALPEEAVSNANNESAGERCVSGGRAMRRPPAAPTAPLVCEKTEPEPTSLIQKQRALFESSDVKAEPRSFVQKQRSLSFDRRKKKAAAQATADGVENVAATNEAASTSVEPQSLIQKQRALFESSDVKAEPRSFVQKQRSLSFDRRKKKAAAQATADGVENVAATNEAASTSVEPQSLIQKQRALFESRDAKPVPERLQKQRSLSFDRRKKKAASEATVDDVPKAAAQAAVDDALLLSGRFLTCDSGGDGELATHPVTGGRHEAATAYFGEHAGPLTRRVLVTVLCAAGTDKSTLLRQRLTRVRCSFSGKLGAAAAPTPDRWTKEIGVKVWPI